MKKTLMSAAIAVSFLIATSAQAVLVTSIPPDGTTTVLSTISGDWASAPSVTAGGFNVFAPSGSEVWYGDSTYGLLDNGSWDNFAWVGGYCYSGDCTATIDLGGLFSSVGGFMNYALSGGLPEHGSGGDPIIEAIGADGITILESYNLFTDAPIVTPGGLNEGAYRGIARQTADIAFLRFSGSYLLMHDLTLNNAVVSESTTLALLGLSLAGFGLTRRRKPA